MKKWQHYLTQIGDPIQRYENFLLDRKIITPDFQQQIRKEALAEVRDALKSATS